MEPMPTPTEQNSDSGQGDGRLTQPVRLLRIEQPYEIKGNSWFFQTIITGGGAIGGQHIPLEEVCRRLEAKAGSGELVRIEGEWFWQPNDKIQP